MAKNTGRYSSNAFSKLILDNAPMSIITIDRDGFITSANKYYQKLSNTRGYRNHNIFSGDFFKREGLVADYRKLLRDGTVVRREKCYEKNANGQDKYLKIVAVPLRDKSGKIEGALSMAEDATEAVVFKNQLAELNRDLERKVEERTEKLNELNKELDKVLNLKSIFVADISHELRTSLTIMQGNLEMLGSPANAEDRQSYEQVLKEIGRMSVMLSDMAMLADSEPSVPKLNYRRIRLDKLIDSVVKSFRVQCRAKNITVNVTRKRAGTMIMADPDKLEKLLMNLMKNAVLYNKENGWIDISVRDEGRTVTLAVEDGGVGIAKDHLPNIFERFYRVEKNRSRSSGGSGLGLAICKRVAEIHGGSIRAKSKPGKGSVFLVRLPKDGSKRGKRK